MDSDVLVLGGGFSGLACAATLARANVRVAVLEKKPHLGGRAYSFRDPATGHSVDNGQHLFMGCYRRTRAFLREIGAESKLQLTQRMRVCFAEAGGGRAALSCPAFVAGPLHLALGITGLKGLSLKDKVGLLRLVGALKELPRQGELSLPLDSLTVRQWLDSIGQSRCIQERLFDPIALGALNEDPSVASATGFVQILREMFFKDAESTRLGLARVGLSELYTDNAREYIESRGGSVQAGQKVVSLLEDQGRGCGVVLESGRRLTAHAVISTLAPWELNRLNLPSALCGPWQTLTASPIVSLTLWLDRPVIDERELLFGLLGTDIQWVFNKTKIQELPGPGQTLALVVSGARALLRLDPKALLGLATRDMTRCFPEFQKAKIVAWKVIKEPYATLSPIPGAEAKRPQPGSGMPGFHFAGDWTNTGLPATIESAVVSAEGAARQILGLAEETKC